MSQKDKVRVKRTMSTLLGSPNLQGLLVRDKEGHQGSFYQVNHKVTRPLWMDHLRLGADGEEPAKG